MPFRNPIPTIQKDLIEMELQKRKANRIQGFDYGQCGAYFVTLCTHNRARLFTMEQTPSCQWASNQIIHKWVAETQNKYQNAHFDKYVIMSDHIHFLISFTEEAPGASLADVMRFFKTMTTNEYIREVKKGNLPPFQQKLWQKSYYDHVIRNEQDYLETWEYIDKNPTKWMVVHGKTP